MLIFQNLILLLYRKRTLLIALEKSSHFELAVMTRVFSSAPVFTSQSLRISDLVPILHVDYIKAFENWFKFKLVPHFAFIVNRFSLVKFY